MLSPVDKPYDIKKIQSYLIYEPSRGLDIELEGTLGNKKVIKPDLKEIVKNELSKILKGDLLINDIWRNVQEGRFQKDTFP